MSAHRGYLYFVSIFVVCVCVTSKAVRGCGGEEFKWQGRLGYFRGVKINWIIPAGAPARALARKHVRTHAHHKNADEGKVPTVPIHIGKGSLTPGGGKKMEQGVRGAGGGAAGGHWCVLTFR